MSHITWCPRCSEVVRKSEDGTWRCTGCSARWNADRRLVVAPVENQASQVVDTEETR